MEPTHSPPETEKTNSVENSDTLPSYNHKFIEETMQHNWNSGDVYRSIESDPRFPKGKFYACSMLPYPSGKLHMGHVRNYSINDVLYRHRRMLGYNVLMPMGWDAFGLPAENAAIQQKLPPAQWTWDNIAYMKKQMQSLGLGIDWSREIATCSPSYYRWTQWLFLRMLEKGIAYLKNGTVNWDPVDQTVLANEQVIDGCGWRSGAPVEKREIPMYYLGISNYASELLEGLEELDWPERVVSMQTHWIGKSQGVRFAFTHTIKDPSGALIQDGKLFVFTSRVDTIMGVTFVAIAAEHPIAQEAAKNNLDLQKFIQENQQGSVAEVSFSTKEKNGFPTGFKVSHPLTGELIDVWVGNYVLYSYGDGAVMGVPAHDERDFAFAKQFGIPIKPVISVKGQNFSFDNWQNWYTSNTGFCINSGPYNGLDHHAAIIQITKDLKQRNLGCEKIQYRLRDWGISRQRYWGTPIPIIHCPECGPQPVPDEDLPVILPEGLIPDGKGNPLLNCEEFLQCLCPKCKKPARRETDTMDTFVDSSWYFMRYTAPDNAQNMGDERTNYWMPVDQYIGGIEHAVLHLLYARFWTKVMADIVIPTTSEQKTCREPFKNLLCQGMVLNHIFSRKTAQGGTSYFSPNEVIQDSAKGSWILKTDGSQVDYKGIGTMSKSKKNGVDPQTIVESYGADAARLFVLFASPPEQTLEWSGTGIEGSYRFLKRLWTFTHQYWIHFAQQFNINCKNIELLPDKISPDQAEIPKEHPVAPKSPAGSILKTIYKLLKQAEYDYKRLQYNTVVSASMKMLNALESHMGDIPQGTGLSDATSHAYAIKKSLSILLKVLYPIVPHITETLWEKGRFTFDMKPLLDSDWPHINDLFLIEENINLVLQINGKTRGTICVPTDASQKEIELVAQKHEAYIKHVGNSSVRKRILVPGRLFNIVT